MRRKSFDSWPCSIARTVDVIGDAWTMLVIRELFYGESRFDGFVGSLGVPRTTLADRLALLVEHGLVERHEYQLEPVRHEYRLTAQGRDLFGVLAVLNAWGDRWRSDGDGVPVVMRHELCGRDLRPQVTCAHCGEAVAADDVTLRAGPGYPVALAESTGLAARFARAAGGR